MDTLVNVVSSHIFETFKRLSNFKTKDGKRLTLNDFKNTSKKAIDSIKADYSASGKIFLVKSFKKMNGTNGVLSDTTFAKHISNLVLSSESKGKSVESVIKAVNVMIGQLLYEVMNVTLTLYYASIYNGSDTLAVQSNIKVEVKKFLNGMRIQHGGEVIDEQDLVEPKDKYEIKYREKKEDYKALKRDYQSLKDEMLKLKYSGNTRGSTIDDLLS